MNTPVFWSQSGRHGLKRRHDGTSEFRGIHIPLADAANCFRNLHTSYSHVTARRFLHRIIAGYVH